MSMSSFEALKVEDQSLLLMMQLFSSRDYQKYLGFVPEEEAKKIKKASAFLAKLNKEQRLKFMVARLKQLLFYQNESVLNSVNVDWIVFYLKKEPAFIQKYLFSLMPRSVQKELVKSSDLKLGDGEVALLSNVTDELKLAIRNSFESQLVSMPYVEFSQALSFDKIILLSAKDLISLTAQIGKLSLATSFSVLGLKETAKYLGHYGVHVQNAIIEALKDVKTKACLGKTEVSLFLKEIFLGFHNVDDLFQRSGLFFIALTIALENEIFTSQLAQRFPYPHGQMLLGYRRVVLQISEQIKDVEKRQSAILTEVIRLAKENAIDSRFASCTVRPVS